MVTSQRAVEVARWNRDPGGRTIIPLRRPVVIDAGQRVLVQFLSPAGEHREAVILADFVGPPSVLTGVALLPHPLLGGDHLTTNDPVFCTRPVGA